MAELMTTDVRAIMDRTPFDVAAVADLRELLNRDPSRYRTLREAVANIKEREKKDKEGKPETHLRLGVGEVLLGRYQSGLDHLKKAGDVGMACYFRGIALENQQKYDQASASFAQAGKLGYDPRNSEMHRAGALRRGGNPDEARKILASLAKQGDSSAEYHFQQGCLLTAAGELVEAAAQFEKTLSLDKDHNGALFELAYINDLYGNDELALEYYKRCTDRPPSRWPRGSIWASSTRTKCGFATPSSAIGRSWRTSPTTPAPASSSKTARRARGCITTRKPSAATPSSSSFTRSPSPTSSSPSAAATASGR